MHEAISPLVIRLKEQWPFGTILVRTRPGGTARALAGLEKVCKALNPGVPFTYQFSDEEFAKLYRSERLVGQLFNGFAGLAIFISCLGLLGLAMFTAEQRTKEIGIRKVLGASVGQLVLLLCRDFLKLVGVAILVASPFAWYAVREWLGQFAYRIDLEWWMFGLAGGLAVGVALLTISVQSTRAALANPVNALRSE
jgi:ABC-type antimicrobial peptide transport system permease subunit